MLPGLPEQCWAEPPAELPGALLLPAPRRYPEYSKLVVKKKASSWRNRNNCTGPLVQTSLGREGSCWHMMWCRALPLCLARLLSSSIFEHTCPPCRR